jgi:hypothetical protein
MLKHDRSIINAYGGPWPQAADYIRAVVTASAPTPNSPKRHSGVSVRARRKALKYTQRNLAQAAGYTSPGPVAAIEQGVGWAAALRRVTLALDRLEDSQQ